MNRIKSENKSYYLQKYLIFFFVSFLHDGMMIIYRRHKNILEVTSQIRNAFEKVVKLQPFFDILQNLHEILNDNRDNGIIPWQIKYIKNLTNSVKSSLAGLFSTEKQQVSNWNTYICN